MKLTTAEMAFVRSKGLYITEKCDGCGKVLNQAVRYTTPGRPETWCSAACQDRAMGWDKVPTCKKAGRAFYMRVCEVCKKEFRTRRNDAGLCSARCRKIKARRSKWEKGSDGTVTDNLQRCPLGAPGGSQSDRRKSERV